MCIRDSINAEYGAITIGGTDGWPSAGCDRPAGHAIELTESMLSRPDESSSAEQSELPGLAVPTALETRPRGAAPRNTHKIRTATQRKRSGGRYELMECEQLAQRVTDQSPAGAARALLDCDDWAHACDCNSVVLVKALVHPGLMDHIVRTIPALALALTADPVEAESNVLQSAEQCRRMKRTERIEQEKALLKTMAVGVEAVPVYSELDKALARAKATMQLLHSPVGSAVVQDLGVGSVAEAMMELLAHPAPLPTVAAAYMHHAIVVALQLDPQETARICAKHIQAWIAHLGSHSGVPMHHSADAPQCFERSCRCRPTRRNCF
eukprot:TRINITY_DN9611_c0_g1_i3.p2 TRINITY_DN9611_c0_g1~~TRINITY_DN9611_c0_g1_i3.p2  ORF type:complete len:324 (-),score=59.48 TRINITY_DN9611_c0_g1_i3:1251-2222(-)